MSAKKLVIVESPAKARTISGYLGADFQVEASVGHIRDLPQPSALPDKLKQSGYKKFAVDVDNNFKPYYVVNPDKKKTVAGLRKDLAQAEELYLATDEDREGEAIAWHLLEVLKPKVPVKRMVFHEITREAIDRALENTRDIDTDLVEAQETRRILDRLYGYEVSPILWRKVARHLSAGRVQSVATRLVVQRERERIAFIPASYFDLNATFSADGEDFNARALEMDGVRFAVGRDFDDHGQLKRQATVMDEKLWEKLAAALENQPRCQVTSVESKPYTRRPAPPFTTSTLQQEAGRKLRMSSRQTMALAQYLYENGYITYMRTDSTALSSQAISAARRQATDLYGADAVPEKPRFYAKKAKGAQEAHEAIRPAGDNFRTPNQVRSALSAQQAALYELIWKRTLASQMNDARGTTDTVRVSAQIKTEGEAHELVFTASGTVITFRGFLAAYEEGKDKSRYASTDSSTALPKLSEGQTVAFSEVDREKAAHVTSPPPRYTEASLVKTLEEKGVGRPSTYASTIGVIIERGYVHRAGQALVPSWQAFSVVRLLEENLASLVDYDFTATMEGDLDQIAAGERDGKELLAHFYFGGGTGGEFWARGLKDTVEGLGDIDARALNSIEVLPGVNVRVGRYGPYLEDAEGKRASVPEELAPDELDAEKVKELFTISADTGRELGKDPDNGNVILVKNGRYGPYFTEVLPEDAPKGTKPRTASLFKTMSIETASLDDALKLLSLPRVVGKDPESGTEITAQNGRYGPYLKKGTDSRSLETEDQIFSITLEQALAIYAQPKTRRGRTAKPPLKELGTDPNSGKPVVIKDGRFGPYITDGTTNVTVPRASTIEDIDADQAYTLLAEKRAKGPAKKRGTRKTAKKTTTKKTTKKTAAKKTTTKRTIAKKTTAKTPKQSAAKK
ncbi:type I DNA topoisomerase [Varibaculum cambriense]|uniref:DNA topoisomerase 1 n=1 Tax=Varibaculum cambriense TaxID=184870 RepID=A0ABX4US96_9ACTO|nr:type I DNA topoisomerase [Varibaculum cambriense]MDU5614107.1 type I DNA topoisomerase [Varibaculum cambriense]PMB90187.1 type I DNA topoisomerase [Varibaculum cambriense]